MIVELSAVRGHLVRWVIAVMATGAVAIAGSLLTAPRNERGLSTVAPAVNKATSTST
ncbi:MAG: hypothetical protein QOH79_1484, partial [Acidimicrobiaceae bacterium]